MDLAHRIINVFTVGSDPFSGNPLAVFEDAAGLSGEQMQHLARQLNLSETTFVTSLDPGDGVDATVRVFTPDYELPFAGHPTLGTAYVVADLLGEGTREVLLGMPAGRVAVSLTAGVWTLTAPVAPSVRDVSATPTQLAEMVGLDADDLTDGSRWVDTGVEQLVLPVRSVEAVRRAVADPRLLRAHGQSPLGESMVYLWAETGADAATGEDTVEARLFFTQGTGIVEDPATGSACANLGGWFHDRGARGLHRVVRQGDAVSRPSQLRLEVTGDGTIRVGATLHQLGAGVIRL